MCYLFGMTHTHKLTRRQLNAVLKTVNRLFSYSQPDGFGFSLQNSDGTRYTERYMLPKQFAGLQVVERIKKALPKNLQTSLLTDTVGEYRGSGGGLLVHGRTSTNQVSLVNTHPFTKGGWTLAHNGVVGWKGAAHPLETTCDSEHLLNMFALGNGLQDVKDLRGYAACLILDPDGRFKVFKDDTAPLVSCYVPSLEASLFASKEHILDAVLKALRIRKAYIFDLESNILLTFPTDPAKIAEYDIERHGGIPSGYVGSGACRAFGWEGEDYYHGPITTKVRDTKPVKTAREILGLEDGEDQVGGSSAPERKRADLDLLDEDAWRSEVARIRNEGNEAEALALEDMLEEELADQAEKHLKDQDDKTRTKSLHTMTDEELERYGL